MQPPIRTLEADHALSGFGPVGGIVETAKNGTALAAPFQGQTMLLAILVALLAGFHMLLVGATARRFLLVARPGFAARVFVALLAGFRMLLARPAARSFFLVAWL